jgi:triacylglycerol esterase/lipase EstA (alpha/beta hydrolase family)
MNHTLPFALSWGKNSKAHFALGSADRLIIFIHGFGGGALKTWKGMSELLNNPDAAHSDIVFYGYRSLTAPARNSATLFRGFVRDAEQVNRAWAHAIWRAGADPDERHYDEILIIAHSLGAVVTRRALLDAVGLSEQWAGKARLLLFGPAHMGTRLVELQNMFKSQPMQFLSDLFTIVQANLPVLYDLTEGSKFLKELNREARAAISAGEKMHVASEVWFGETDKVVITDRFCSDPVSHVAANEGHCSVCRMPQAVHIIGAHL